MEPSSQESKKAMLQAGALFGFRDPFGLGGNGHEAAKLAPAHVAALDALALLQGGQQLAADGVSKGTVHLFRVKYFGQNASAIAETTAGRERGRLLASVVTRPAYGRSIETQEPRPLPGHISTVTLVVPAPAPAGEMPSG